MKAEKYIIIIGAILLVLGIILSMVNVGDNTQGTTLAISLINQKTIIMNAISMFLIGFGSVVLAIGALKFLQKKK